MFSAGMTVRCRGEKCIVVDSNPLAAGETPAFRVRVRAIEGNYDAYQSRLRHDDDAPEETSPAPRAKSNTTSKQSTKKRRFPYRKVTDLEDEIFIRETHIQQRQCELTEPSVLRDGERVREVKQEIQREQETIKTLYEHWEEATELNW